MAIIRQVYCTLIAISLSTSLGIMMAWPSSTIKLFASSNTTLNRPMSEIELALLGSLSSISALFGTAVSGFLLDVIGRKYSLILFSLPQAVAWSITSTCTKVEAILAAVLISGFGGCMFMILPAFISEICQENIRGTMTSGTIIFYGIGLMISYILGGVLDYHTMNYVCLGFTTMAVLGLTFVKETPTFLMKKGSDKEAEKSLAFYRSLKPGSKELLTQMDAIRRTLNPDLDDVSPEEEKLKPESQAKEKLSFFQFMKKSRSSRRALGLILTMNFIAIFQGLVVVQVYSEPLFEEALPSMSANLTSVLFALVNTIAGFSAAFLVDTAGRRPVMIYSSIVTGICCVALGTQIQFHWGPHWVTGLFLFAFCLSCTAGSGTVPYVLLAEVFLPEVRGIMSMIAVEWAWICSFIILFIFNPLVTVLGLGPIFYFFAIVSLFATIFCSFYMPETKGLTVDVIQTLLVEKNTQKV